MASIVLNNYSGTGQTVTPGHFGGNAIWDKNTDGNGGGPTTNFTDAVDALGVTNIRYPAGQGDGGIDITVPASSGGLNEDLVSFMDWVVSQNQSGSQILATIVIPTRIYHLKNQRCSKNWRGPCC